MLFPHGELPHLVETYGYGAIGGLVALEGMGIPLPGETALVFAAVLAGTNHILNIWLVIATAAAGAVVGDNVGFRLGRGFGYRLLVRYGHHIGATVPRIKLGQYLFHRYGGRTRIEPLVQPVYGDELRMWSSVAENTSGSIGSAAEVARILVMIVVQIAFAVVHIPPVFTQIPLVRVNILLHTGSTGSVGAARMLAKLALILIDILMVLPHIHAVLAYVAGLRHRTRRDEGAAHNGCCREGENSGFHDTPIRLADRSRRGRNLFTKAPLQG